MGERRRVHARVATALVTVAAGVLAVVSGPAAVAVQPYPLSCVQEATTDGLELPRYSRAELTDLDIGLHNMFFPDDGPIVLAQGESYSGAPAYTWTLRTRYPDRFGYVIFDNEATYDGDYGPQPSGVPRIRPEQWFPYNPPAAYGEWSVLVGNSYGGGPYGRTVPFTAILTWSDCDGDRDFVGDKTGDNCVGLNNPGQEDRDGDRVGDACDPDDDNDGVADAGDNCPTIANGDQTDWDGDRVGNACDASPGAAPAPPAPPTPPTTSPTLPGTVPPPSTCATGCAYTRTVGLRYRKARHRLTGMVDSVAAGCRAGVEVTLWRKRSGADHELVVLTTKPTGAFRTKAPRRAGRYYATVASPDQPLCGTAASRVVRITRR